MSQQSSAQTAGIGLTQLWPRGPCPVDELFRFAIDNDEDPRRLGADIATRHVLLAGSGGCPWAAVWAAVRAAPGGDDDDDGPRTVHVCVWEPQAPQLARFVLLLRLVQLAAESRMGGPADKDTDTDKAAIGSHEAEVEPAMSLDEWALTIADLFGNARCRAQSWRVLQERVLDGLIRYLVSPGYRGTELMIFKQGRNGRGGRNP